MCGRVEAKCYRAKFSKRSVKRNVALTGYSIAK